MQTGRHCPCYKEVMFVSTHNRSCNLVKPSAAQCRVRSCRHTDTCNHRCLQWSDEIRSKWWGCGVWCTGWLLFSVLCHCLCAPQINTRRAIVLAHSLRWNKTVPSAENRTTEGKKPAVLIGIPSSWSSWIQTLSHSELTQGNGKRSRDGEGESDREHIFDCGQKAGPTSPPPPPPLIFIPQLPMWPHFVAKPPFREVRLITMKEKRSLTS